MNSIQFLDSYKKMPLMSLTVRTTFVQVGDARILISPGSKLSPKQIEDLGSVTDIVAPNLLHTAGVPAVAQKYPKARVWGPPGAQKKHPELTWLELQEATWPYQNQGLKIISLMGIPQVKESFFFHEASKSMIATDACFNLSQARGPGAWVILHLFGTYRKFGVSRLFAKFIKDKQAFGQSMHEVLSKDFDSLVMSHGEPLKHDAKASLREALIERGLLAH